MPIHTPQTRETTSPSPRPVSAPPARQQVGGSSYVPPMDGFAGTPVRPPADDRGAPIQRKTQVNALGTKKYRYDFDDKGNNRKSDDAGHKVEAYLDPKDPKQGSSPSSAALWGAMTDLGHLGYESMVKGHLLNGQLGGPGVAANLFPITTAANNKHKLYAENMVKHQVAHGPSPSSSKGVYYSVEVTEASYSSQSPSAKFTCESYLWDKSKGPSHSAVDGLQPFLPPLDIESNPAKGSTGLGQVTGLLTGVNAFGNHFTYAQNNPTSKSFPTSQLPTGWGEIGSGRGTGRDWSHTSGMGLNEVPKATKRPADDPTGPPTKRRRPT